ncbi:MAG: glutamyl-tRNA reductase [Syntrophomonadaceae bacterium]|jgi:glutamyl-tRNA reductase|nr:glutamyl-tRNA reductase [Syntrophomonadaceae bacterium]MDH7498375.1 glutamyl-tRNA reductase [Syntrophomonadaceae bacterium]
MYVVLAGLNHRTAPVHIRERLAFSTPVAEEVYARLREREELEGAVILSTCNRTEIYATVRDGEAGPAALEEFMAAAAGMAVEELRQYMYQPRCHDAIGHLFRVAAGLDSMVLGETQVLGQVKDAYLRAVELGASDVVLNTLFQKALHAGKRVRTETGLDRHAVSISYAAVELAKGIFGSLAGKTVLVIGAGEMSELTARYLVDNGVATVMVSNRSFARAQCLAERIAGRAIQFSELPQWLEAADIVISCTAASHFVIRYEAVEDILARRAGRPLFVIDIAVPRDVDPRVGSIPGVHLYDIDSLKEVVDANLLERKKAARAAEVILQDELEEFNQWLATLYVVPVVKAVKRKGEEIRQAEVTRALNRLGTHSPRQERIIREMASSIVNQLLHFPVVRLKEMAVTNQGHLYAEVARHLFALDMDEEERLPDASAD